MNNAPNRQAQDATSRLVVKICYALIFLILGLTAFFRYRYSTDIIPGWYQYIFALMIVISISQRREHTAEDAKKMEWKSMSLPQKVFWASVVVVWISIIFFALYFGILRPMFVR